MPTSSHSTPFSRTLRVAVVLTLLMGALLIIEGVAERQVDRAYRTRYETRLLVNELRHSSDELTRLARTFALTGDTSYQEAYLSVLAARDGEASPLERGQAVYKGVVQHSFCSFPNH